MKARQDTMLAEWARLGIAWDATPYPSQPDVEPLIVRSIDHVPANPRLLVLVASWLSVCWRCVGRDRLRTLALEQPPVQQAILGFMLESVDMWSPLPVWTSVHSKLARPAEPEPLLKQDRDRPSLRRLVEMESSPLARSWGLLSLPIEQKRDAIRPASWTLQRNPRLQVRSFFKGSLKTSLLALIDHHPGIFSPTQLARECGVTRKAIYDAIEDLEFSRLMSRSRLSR